MKKTSTLIFGIDCATKAGKVGMVVAQWNALEKIRILSVHDARSRSATLAEELKDPILGEMAKPRFRSTLARRRARVSLQLEDDGGVGETAE